MLKDTFPRKLSGALALAVIDARTGQVISTFVRRNLIVATGYAAAAQALAGVAGAAITAVRVGTSTSPPATTDTAITNAVQVPVVSVEYPDSAVQFNFQINANTANGLNIAEWGLITADGRLFSRMVRDEIIAKTDAIEILGNWTINL